MIELRTLGSVQLDAPDRPEARSLASQPKRLALLVYLAMAEPPTRREALLALFWPESDQEKGRQVLRQTVYLLRQSLGPDAIGGRSDEDLALGADLRCDARQFESLIASGHLREALDLYRGDFLAGFFAPGTAHEFDEWVDQVRGRLRGMAGTAAWSLARQDEQAGDNSGALYWARRAVALDRDHESGVRDLMLLHQRLGDRIGALRVYDEHVTRVKRELDAEPGGALQRLAASLRADTAVTAPTVDAAAARAAGENRRRTRTPVVWMIAAILVVAAGIAFALLRPLGPASRAAGAEPIIAVGPIVDVISADSTAEVPVASDLLATSLTRLTGVRVIPAVRLYDVQSQLKAAGKTATMLASAQQAGAERMLRGTLHRDATGRVTLDAQVLDLGRGTVVAAVRVDGKDLFELVDRATDALAARLGAAPPTVPIADVTTRSLVAYRLYQEGLRAFYATNDTRTAQGLLRAAVAEDSTFAMAVYYYGLLTMVTQGERAGTALIDRAAVLAEKAPDRERLLIRYRVAAQHQASAAVALAETLSVRYPTDLDALAAVGALHQRSSDWAGAATRYREVIRRDSLSLRTSAARCLACEAYVDLWWTYIYADSMPQAEAVIREWQARGGPAPSTRDLLSIALERQGRFAEARELWHDAVPPGVSLRHAMIAIRAGDYFAARATLSQLRAATAPAELDWWNALILRNEGRPTEALRLQAIEPALRAALLYEAGRYRDALALSDRTAREIRAGDSLAWPRRLTWQLVHAATALAALGDTARLPAIADSVERLGGASFFGRDPRLHYYVRGLLWLARGDTLRAADAFRASVWSWTDGYTRANYELARALIALQRPREAIYPLQAALRGDLQSSNLYLSRTEVHALLARAFEASGLTDSAAAHRGAVRSAWAHAEADLPARALLTGPARPRVSSAATRPRPRAS